MKPATTIAISGYLDSHQYPGIFFRSSMLVRSLQWLNGVVTLRNWYVRRELNRLLHSRPADFKLLDAGCGLGDFAIYTAKKYPRAEIVGVDFSESNIRLAEKLAVDRGLNNVVFENQDMAENLTNSRFDIVLCSAVLQSIKNDSSVLRDLSNALVEGGFLLLYVPVRHKRYLPMFDKIERKYLERFFYKYSDEFSHHRYSTDEIMKKVVSAGLKVEKRTFSHGAAGAVAFELYSMFLVVLKALPLWLLPVVVPVYMLMVFPLQLFLMILDYLTRHDQGNGLLIVGRKG